MWGEAGQIPPRTTPYSQIPGLLFRSQGDNQLLCCVASDGRHAGGPLCDDIQRLRGTVRRKVDVRTVHVQRVQQPGCLLFHGQHIAPVLHISGQVSAHLCRSLSIY